MARLIGSSDSFRKHGWSWQSGHAHGGILNPSISSLLTIRHSRTTKIENGRLAVPGETLLFGLAFRGARAASVAFLCAFATTLAAAQPAAPGEAPPFVRPSVGAVRI